LLVVVFAMNSNIPLFSSSGKFMTTLLPEMVPQKLVLNLNSANRSFPQTATVSPEPTVLMNSNKRYVLSEGYWEELTLATRNFMGLVKIAGSWGARAVLPFTAGSQLYGIKAKYTLDLVYDLDDIKRVCNKFYSLPMPVKFEEFLSDASRNVVLMGVDYKSRVSGKHTARCSDWWRRHLIPVLNHLNKVTKEKGLQIFNDVGCCVVYNHHPTTSVEIAKGCKLVDGEFTVLLKQWRGIVNDYRMTYRLVIDKREDVPIISDFNHSKWVIGNASRLFHDITKTDKCVAIHVRAERLIIAKKLNRCLKLLNEVLSKFKSNHSDFHVLYFGDEELDSFRNMINNANVTRFNGAKYGAVTDRGFAAQVEQHTASLCKALIVSGGGSFQYRTVRRFNEFRDHLPHLAACEHTQVV